jgi:hypothetical protein
MNYTEKLGCMLRKNSDKHNENAELIRIQDESRVFLEDELFPYLNEVALGGKYSEDVWRGCDIFAKFLENAYNHDFILNENIKVFYFDKKDHIIPHEIVHKPNFNINLIKKLQFHWGFP